MSRRNNIFAWVVIVLISALALYMLRAILLPFVVGFAIAYLLDPWADRLEAAGLSVRILMAVDDHLV